MIIFVLTRGHRYTHKVVAGWRDGPEVSLWTYDRLLKSRRLPGATWVFGDFDRLSFWELELAARIWRQLKSAGLTVLNDPARVLQRYDLLRELNRRGINGFNVWRVSDGAVPERFPVFLRTEAAHRGAIGGLIGSPDELKNRIEAALEEGYPRRDLLVVEYAAEPIAENLFRKLAVFRIGNRTVPALAVHEAHWSVRGGTQGIATPDLYDEEAAIIEGNPYGPQLMGAFQAGQIDYGRADFSFPRGELAVYEINTNPAIGRPASHPSPVRLAAYRSWRRQYAEALAELEPAGVLPGVDLDGPLLRQQRRRDAILLRSRWTV